MSDKVSFITNFLELFKFVDQKDKIKFFFCILMMVVTSLLEVLSIGILIPYVTIILSPEKILNFNRFEFLDFQHYSFFELQLIFTIFFCFSIIFANLFKIYVLYLSVRLSKIISLNISSDIYKKLIFLEYRDLKKINSAQVISLVTDKMEAVGSIILNFLNTCVAILITFGVILLLLFINFKITIIALIISVILYLSFGFFANFASAFKDAAANGPVSSDALRYNASARSTFCSTFNVPRLNASAFSYNSCASADNKCWFTSSSMLLLLLTLLL